MFWKMTERLACVGLGIIAFWIIEDAYYSIWHPMAFIILLAISGALYGFGYFRGKNLVWARRFNQMPWDRLPTKRILARLKAEGYSVRRRPNIIRIIER